MNCSVGWRSVFTPTIKGYGECANDDFYEVKSKILNYFHLMGDSCSKREYQVAKVFSRNVWECIGDLNSWHIEQDAFIREVGADLLPVMLRHNRISPKDLSSAYKLVNKLSVGIVSVLGLQLIYRFVDHLTNGLLGHGLCELFVDDGSLLLWLSLFAAISYQLSAAQSRNIDLSCVFGALSVDVGELFANDVLILSDSSIKGHLLSALSLGISASTLIKMFLPKAGVGQDLCPSSLFIHTLGWMSAISFFDRLAWFFSVGCNLCGLYFLSSNRRDIKILDKFRENSNEKYFVNTFGSVNSLLIKMSNLLKCSNSTEQQCLFFIFFVEKLLLIFKSGRREFLLPIELFIDKFLDLLNSSPVSPRLGDICVDKLREFDKLFEFFSLGEMPDLFASEDRGDFKVNVPMLSFFSGLCLLYEWGIHTPGTVSYLPLALGTCGLLIASLAILDSLILSDTCSLRKHREIFSDIYSGGSPLSMRGMGRPSRNIVLLSSAEKNLLVKTIFITHILYPEEAVGILDKYWNSSLFAGDRKIVREFLLTNKVESVDCQLFEKYSNIGFSMLK